MGLTGGIASGKSAVADQFARLGVPVVDTDRIAHALTQAGGEAIPALVDAFGADCLDSQGALDRKAMRGKAFGDPSVRRRLEGILHPLIRAEATRLVEVSPGPYVILVVPLLVESGQYKDICDRVLVVDCDPELQVRRASMRDGVEPAKIEAIIAAQSDRRARLAQADDVIENGGGLDDLHRQVERLHRSYLGLAKRTQTDPA